MKKQLICGLALVLAAPLFGQTLYSPKHMASSEGQYYAYYFGRWKEGRSQFIDGENRNKVAAIKAINLRLDNRPLCGNQAKEHEHVRDRSLEVLSGFGPGSSGIIGISV